MRTYRLFVASAFILCLSFSIFYSIVSLAGQISSNGLWNQIGETHLVPSETDGPYKYWTFAADITKLNNTLGGAPMEFSDSDSQTVMTFPMPDGSYERVRIEESPILSTELQEEYPEIRTYRAYGLDDPTASGRFDYTPAGFHGMLISESGTVYVNPKADSGPSHYISFWKKDVIGEPPVCCQLGDSVAESLISLLAFPANNPSGDQLTTYRLAVSATGEYTQFFGGVAATAAQIATTINRVTGIYEREFAIRLNLVNTNIYANPATDPFTGNNVSTMLGENQTDLDTNVGDANYDIGHIFSQGGGGGVANVGVCTTGSKALGATSLANPSGDVFDVDFVAHEMGHQFSGSHTWNGTSGSCSAAQFQANSSYEPASGSTIMAYAGICAGQNVQANSNDYFHTRSFDQITAYRDGTGACGTVTATGNNPPTVEAGPDCFIPTSTPFTLTAEGDDVDGDALTYCWEQFDLGTQDGNPQPTFVTGPLFRSRPPTSETSRTFPRFVDILSGAATPYEVLPSVDRTLNFRVTVRDNQASGGGVDYDSMTVIVIGTPFEVTFPAAGDSLECGDDETITWNVGGGSVASNVEILISSDGGASFSSLVSSTTNDGSHTVMLPTGLTTTTARIMLKPSSNCFFAVSDEFSIVDSNPPDITCPGDIIIECTESTEPSNTGSATAVDVCDPDPGITFTDMVAAGACPQEETITRTWTATDATGRTSNCVQIIEVVDTIGPVISCNAPPTIIPPDAPISFTATAIDNCDTNPIVVIVDFDCFKFTKKGKRIDKTESCEVLIAGDTITILDSGGVGDRIEWTVEATDACGNTEPLTCGVDVVNPAK